MAAKVQGLLEFLWGGWEFILLSTVVTFAMLFASPKEWKLNNRSLLLSGVLTGSISGIVAANTPGISDFSHLIAFLGVVTGPKTLASIQGKTLFDVLKEIIELREKTEKNDTRHTKK